MFSCRKRRKAACRFIKVSIMSLPLGKRDTPFRARGFRGCKGFKRFRGFWWAPFKKKGRHYDKTIQPPCGRGEQANRACGAMEMPPDPRLRRYFPRRGKFALCLSLLSYPVNTIPVISHLWWLFPLWWLRHHLCHGVKRVTGFSVAQGLPTNPVPLPPLFEGALWVLSIVLHDTKGKRRAVYSAP